MKAYCSSCFTPARHRLIEQNYLRRNVYICDICSSKTLMCRVPKCEHMASGGEKWDSEFCAVHDGTIAGFEKLTRRLRSIDSWETVVARDAINAQKVAMISAGVATGAVVLGPMALAAAPAMGGSIGVMMGLSGAAATKAGLAAVGGGALAAGGLGMAGGVAVLTATGTALGGTLGGVVSNAYFSEIDGFSIERVKPGTGPKILFVDGFLTQGTEKPTDWETQLRKIYPDNPWYYVRWESKRLRDIAKTLSLGEGGRAAVELGIRELAKRASKKAAAALGPLGAALATAGLLVNPWHVAMVKAEKTGILLADIIARTNSDYILMGHSLGARVCYYAMASLGTRATPQIVEAHLLGGAIGNQREDWRTACRAVTGKIFNYHSDEDYVLACMYQAGTFFRSNPIGRHPIRNVRKVQNVNVTELVKGHTAFKTHFSRYARSA